MALHYTRGYTVFSYYSLSGGGVSKMEPSYYAINKY